MKPFETISCACGRTHAVPLSTLLVEPGAIRHLPRVLSDLGAEKPFLLADTNTFAAAGESVVSALRESAIPSAPFIFSESPAPDERAVGAAVMHFDRSCDAVVGIGSGVINDIGKIVAHTAGLPYISIATAPSMDGYASATSSMELSGLKTSVPSKCPDAIIGDLDVLAAAPLHLRLSGLGDMLAKYISICEWRLSAAINGEYDCPHIATMIRQSLAACVENAQGLLDGDLEATRAVFEGLVTAGAAMAYAGCSRPASGVEHYISHIFDMRALAFGLPASTHGYQCAVGTLLAAKLYEHLLTLTPNRKTALTHAAAFDYDAYKPRLRALLGPGAEAMIRLEATEGKYDKTAHAARLETILARWDELCAIIRAEIPPYATLLALWQSLGAPTTVAALGIPACDLGAVFEATRDIRDKYVLSRLAFDLGLTDELKALLSADTP